MLRPTRVPPHCCFGSPTSSEIDSPSIFPVTGSVGVGVSTLVGKTKRGHARELHGWALRGRFAAAARGDDRACERGDPDHAPDDSMTLPIDRRVAHRRIAVPCLPLRARSSAGERPLHTREVAGSIPAAPIERQPTRPRRPTMHGRVERGIYRRPGTSEYEITFTDSTGRQRWQKVEGGIREARAGRGEVLSKLSRGERLAPSRITLGEFVVEWLEGQEGRVHPKRPTTATKATSGFTSSPSSGDASSRASRQMTWPRSSPTCSGEARGLDDPRRSDAARSRAQQRGSSRDDPDEPRRAARAVGAAEGRTRRLPVARL